MTQKKSPVHKVDAWLWRRGIDHPAIRPLLRNLFLLTGLCLLAGLLLWPVTTWLFWCGTGLAVMAYTFWSLARFFLRIDLGRYSNAFLRIVLLRWTGRLLLLAGVLYVLLIQCKAPVSALVGGLIVGTLIALVSYARAVNK